MVLKLFPQRGREYAVRRFFIIARVFSPSFFPSLVSLGMHLWCLSTISVFFHFLFTAHIRTGSCLSLIRSLIILQQSFFPAIVPLLTLWILRPSGECSVTTFPTQFCALFMPSFITCYGGVTFIVTSFPDNENKDRQIEAKAFMMLKSLHSLRKFLENYLSQICW